MFMVVLLRAPTVVRWLLVGDGDRRATVGRVVELVDEGCGCVGSGDPGVRVGVGGGVEAGGGVVFEDGGPDDGPVQRALFDNGFLCLVVVEHVAKHGAEQQTRASWDLLPAVTDPCCGHHHEASGFVRDHRVDDHRCSGGECGLVAQAGAAEADDDGVVAGHCASHRVDVEDVSLVGLQRGVVNVDAVDGASERGDLMALVECRAEHMLAGLASCAENDDLHS